MSAATTSLRVVEKAIVAKLAAAFQPTTLDIANESHKHNVPRGSETHFKVTVVSAAFDGLALIKRHRLVNGALREELSGPVHALSISARTPTEWAEDSTLHTTPPCFGGPTSEGRKMH